MDKTWPMLRMQALEVKLPVALIVPSGKSCTFSTVCVMCLRRTTQWIWTIWICTASGQPLQSPRKHASPHTLQAMSDRLPILHVGAEGPQGGAPVDPVGGAQCLHLGAQVSHHTFLSVGGKCQDLSRAFGGVPRSAKSTLGVILFGSMAACLVNFCHHQALFCRIRMSKRARQS